MKKQATSPCNIPLRAALSFGGRQCRKLGRNLLPLLAMTALLAAPASAIAQVMPMDESMVDRSPIIVFGEVLSVLPGLDASGPATDHLFAVEEVMKGFLGGSAIIVRQPGGVAADGTVMTVTGMPRLGEGDRVLLFLDPEENGAHGIVEYGLGMFFEAWADGRSFLLREPSLEGAAALPGGETSFEPVGRRVYREAGAFRRWIADRAAGVQRPSDYFEAELPDDPVAEPPRSAEASIVVSESAGLRDAAADFNLHSANAYAFGIAYAQGRFHVVDRTDRRVYAYRGSDGRRDAAADFNLHSDNANPYGITYAQGRFYLVDRTDRRVYASRGSDGLRDPAADFNLHSDNANPYGLTYGEDHFYVVDRTDLKVYAYRGSDGRRDAAADFDLSPDNSQPYEIAYAQGHFYVVDRTDRKVYVYAADGSRGGAAGPDLVVESPRSNESSVAAGDAFRFAATVRNSGDARSEATTLRYYRSSDSRITTSDTAVGTDAVGALAASATDRQSIGVRAPSSAGTYYYGACVDAVSGESNTGNNCSSAVRVTVTGGGSSAPDLVVQSPSVSDSSLTTGQSFTLRATVRNSGDGRSASTVLRYYRSSDSTISTSDTQIGTDSVGALSASGTSAESISLTAPSSAGTYYYGACVDSVSGESATNNNCSEAVRVTVTSGGGGGDAVTGQITTCSGSRRGSLINVTIRGFLRANRRVTNVFVTAYANGLLVGTDSTSRIAAGSSWSYRITGSILDPTATTLTCNIEARFTAHSGATRTTTIGGVKAESPVLLDPEE